MPWWPGVNVTPHVSWRPCWGSKAGNKCWPAPRRHPYLVAGVNVTPRGFLGRPCGGAKADQRVFASFLRVLIPPAPRHHPYAQQVDERGIAQHVQNPRNQPAGRGRRV
jgi:hypothetical protein